MKVYLENQKEIARLKLRINELESQQDCNFFIHNDHIESKIVIPDLKEINFKLLREAKGYSTTQVSEILKCNKSYITMFENHIKNPKYNTVKRIFDLYTSKD